MSLKAFRSCRLAVSTAIVVASLVAAVPATAGTKSQSATISGAGGSASATAKCKSGQKATGGGFRTSPPAGLGGLDTAYDIVYESRKVGQRSWRVSATQESFGTFAALPTIVTALAYCSDAPSTKARSSSITASAGSIISAGARCNSGKAQAGGFHVTPYTGGPPLSLIIESARSGNKTWLSRAVAEPGTSLTSYVYCGPEKLDAKSGEVTSSTALASGTAISGSCKSGKKPLAGGFSVPNAFTGGYWYLPYESLKTGKAWRASAVHAGTPPTTLRSTAYCG